MSRARRRVFVAVRAIVGVGLLGWLLSRTDLRAIGSILASVSLGWLLAAAAFQMLAKVVWTDRWRCILTAVGVRMPFGELLALVFVGLFFNNFLPTSVGGDLVRGWYSGRGATGRSRGMAVVLIERLLGLITLAATAAVAGAVLLAMPDGRLPRGLVVPTTVIAAVGAVGGAVPFLWGGWRRILGIEDRLRRVAPGPTEALLRGLDLFRDRRADRGRIVAASVGLQVVAVLFHVATARAVGIEVGAAWMFLIVPLAVVASMIPVTLNGLGVREGVLVALTVGAGAERDPAAAFAVLALAVSLSFAAVGGIVYPFLKAPEPDGSAEESR